MRFTGFLFFSLMCLLSVRGESKNLQATCSAGTRWCLSTQSCLFDDDPCPNNTLLLEKKKISLEKGEVFKCEADKLTRIEPGYWICGTPEDLNGKK